MKAAGAPSTTFHWLALAACAAALSCGSDAGPSPQPTPTPQAVCGNGRRGDRRGVRRRERGNGDGCLVTCQRPASWVSSDVHAHTTGCSRSFTPEAVAAQFKAQGIQVAASLVWGTGFDDDAPLFTGRDHPLSTPGFILHYDLEVSHFPPRPPATCCCWASTRCASRTTSSTHPRRACRSRTGRAASRGPSLAWRTASTGRPTARSRSRRAAAASRGRSSSRRRRGTLGFLSVERMPMDRGGRRRLPALEGDC